MWELYAMWTWIPAFAAASIAARGGTAGRLGSLVAFVAIASGAVGCVVAGTWADAWGKARIAGAAMVVSATCAASAGLVFGRPLPLLFLLAVVWGFPSSPIPLRSPRWCRNRADAGTWGRR